MARTKMQRWIDIAQKGKNQMGINIWIRAVAILPLRGVHHPIYGVDIVPARVPHRLDHVMFPDHLPDRDQGQDQVQWEVKKGIREDVISREVLVYHPIGLWHLMVKRVMTN